MYPSVIQPRIAQRDGMCINSMKMPFQCDDVHSVAARENALVSLKSNVVSFVVAK